MIQQMTAQLLQRAIDQTGVGVVISDPQLPDNPIIYVNKGFEDVTGYCAEEVIGKNCRFLQGAQTAPEHIAVIRTAIQLKQSCEIEIVNYKKNGQLFWNELHIIPLWHEDGTLLYFLAIQKDITARKQAEAARILYEKVFDNTLQGVMITDAEATILHVNEAFTTITGYLREEAIGKKPTLLSSGKQKAPFYTKLWTLLTSKGQWEGELWNKRKDGEIYPEFLNISEVRDAQGVVTNYVAIFTDITARKQREHRLTSLTMSDPLTKIGNRRAFDLYIAEKWSMLEEIEEPISLLLFDIDYFKQYNDFYGHVAGDATLKRIAQQMAKHVQEQALVARYGGEEFVVVLPQANAQQAKDTAQHILTSVAALAIPHEASSVSTIVTLSCGVATCVPTQRMTIEQLIEQADGALYEAKRKGRNQLLQVLYEAGQLCEK